jgi:hypothetical protein
MKKYYVAFSSSILIGLWLHLFILNVFVRSLKTRKCPFYDAAKMQNMAVISTNCKGLDSG